MKRRHNERAWVPVVLLVCALSVGTIQASGNCGGSVVITAVGQGSGTMNLDVALHNPSPFPQKTYVVLHVMLDGQSLRFVESLVVPAGSGVQVRFGFLTTVQPIEVITCGDKPTGIAESSDPVAMKIITEEQETEGSGEEGSDGEE